MKSWNCVCETENDADAKSCRNCSREKPPYLSSKIGVSSKLESESDIGILLLEIVKDYLGDLKELNNELDRLKLTYMENAAIESKLTTTAEWASASNKNLRLERNKNEFTDKAKRCLSLIKQASSHGVEAPKELRSDIYFSLGVRYAKNDQYSAALKAYEKSFSFMPDQASLFNIALNTTRMAAKVDPKDIKTGFLGGKKVDKGKQEAAEKIKKQQEIDLFKRVIKFHPFTNMAISSAQILIEDYGVKIDTDLIES